MLFNSIEFIFYFLPITLIVFFSIGAKQYHRMAMSWLVLSSLFFYGWWNIYYLWILIFSIIFNFNFGLVLRKNKRKIILVIGICTNLGVLAYYKYTNFIIDNISLIANRNIEINNIILPLAISFFTFQQIAYLVDIYRNEDNKSNFLHYSLFVTFFPQLISGPIVHHKEILPQFSTNAIYKFKIENISNGLSIFIIGLFKKVVLADGIAAYANPVFNAAETGLEIEFIEAWGGAFAYTLQLYFDFSGYADMAIGLALMFGIVLPLNFNSPYKSKSIIEFWRKWHMTLSRFLKDYLYIPLGGNKKGSKHLNIFTTMLIGGLWHGAAWNFVIWGSLHGIFIVVNHLWRSFKIYIGHKPNPEKNNYLYLIISTSITFLSVTVAWVFFRSESYSGAINILKGLLGINGIVLHEKLAAIIPDPIARNISFEGNGLGNFPDIWGALWILIMLFIVFIAPNSYEAITNYNSQVKKAKIVASKATNFLIHVTPILLGLLFFISVKSMLSSSDSDFLYFNF